jgi:hypothetical protein
MGVSKSEGGDIPDRSSSSMDGTVRRAAGFVTFGAPTGKREAAKRWAQHVSTDATVGVKWGYVLVSETDVKTATGSWPALRSLGVWMR